MEEAEERDGDENQLTVECSQQYGLQNGRDESLS